MSEEGVVATGQFELELLRLRAQSLAMQKRQLQLFPPVLNRRLFINRRVTLYRRRCKSWRIAV